jgi:23S rRNA pseudouridine955/2504/2580 synthase
MRKSFIVDSTCNDMRIDRWLRHTLGKIPQSLIEKNLRSGKIKLNKKKVKSLYKIKTNDKIDLFNLNFKETIVQKKILLIYLPKVRFLKIQNLTQFIG